MGLLIIWNLASLAVILVQGWRLRVLSQSLEAVDDCGKRRTVAALRAQAVSYARWGLTYSSSEMLEQAARLEADIRSSAPPTEEKTS